MNNKPFVVGIAGGSASGKSTLSLLLCNLLNEAGVRAKVVSMDLYYLTEENLPRAKGYIDESKMYIDYNHPDAFDISRFNTDIDLFIESDEYDVIIVEGILVLYHNELLKKLALKIFVDCPSDVRIIRRMRRNMEWGLTFDEIADVYTDLVRFRHDEYVEPTRTRADIVINGLEPFDKTCENLIEIAIKEAR